MPVVKIKNKAEFYGYMGEDDKLKVTMFYDPEGNSSKDFEPRFTGLSDKYTNVHFFKVDAVASKKLAAELNVVTLPTSLFWKTNEVDRYAGVSEVAMETKIKNHMG